MTFAASCCTAASSCAVLPASSCTISSSADCPSGLSVSASISATDSAITSFEVPHPQHRLPINSAVNNKHMNFLCSCTFIVICTSYITYFVTYSKQHSIYHNDCLYPHHSLYTFNASYLVPVYIINLRHIYSRLTVYNQRFFDRHPRSAAPVRLNQYHIRFLVDIRIYKLHSFRFQLIFA